MQLPPLVASDADASTLARAVLEQAAAPLDEVASFLGAPAVELEASAVSARVAVLAANEGRCFVHHEHRLSPLLPDAARPELEVGLGEGEFIPEDWIDGVLHVPKYFSAFLEAPLPVFNPSHRAKWRPHELLHKLSGFAWRPDITRFEAYLTARLSELLPVVHWYGFDEIGRYACEEHRGVRPDRTHCIACERGLVPHWQAGAGLPEAERAAAHALEHLQTELGACARELEHGRAVVTPRPGLDASSDAVGYLRAHWNRITAWSFGAWVERFGGGHLQTCAEHLEHVRDLAAALLQRPAALAPADERRQARDRLAAADLAYRVLLHVEALDTDAAEDALLPWVDALAAGEDLDGAVSELARRLRAIDPAAAERTLATGWSWSSSTPGAQRSLAAGLRGALPRSLADVDEADLVASTARFAEADHLPRPTPLASRFAAHAAHKASPWADLARLEAWLRDEPAQDLEAERFAALPEDTTEAGRVRLNETARRGTFARTVLDALLSDEPSEPGLEADAALIAIRWAGEPRVLEETPEVRAALEAAENGVLEPGDATDALLERGFILWFPPAR